MRKTRKKKQKVTSGVVSILVLALLMVGLGFATGKYLLSPLLQRSISKEPNGESGNGTQEPENPPVEEPTPGDSTITVKVTLEPLSVHIAQLGAYSTKDIAQRAADMAIREGVSAAVMNPDPLYRVLCCATGSKESLSKFAEEAAPKLTGILGADGKPYLTTFETKESSFDVTGDKTTVQSIEQAFDTLEDSMSSLLDFWNAYYLGSKTEVNLDTVQKDVEQAKESLEKLTPDSNIKTAYDVALAIATKMQTAVKEAAKVQANSATSPVEAMTEFIELIDGYAQALKGL